jgi:peptide/nickel transport system substrate-binding protein
LRRFSPAQMRQHPMGTGPFKFVEYKPNESVKLTRNPDYWKSGRPYLDGLEFPIVSSVATRNLMFIAGNVDVTLSYGVSMPLMRDIKSQASNATCTITTDNGARNLIINPAKPPLDNPELRRALSLTLDRKAFIDILVKGQRLVGRSPRTAPPSPGTCGRSQPNQSHDPAGPANRVWPFDAGPNPSQHFESQNPVQGNPFFDSAF